MQTNEKQEVFPECFQFPESLRLLWEAMHKAIEDWGMDRADVAALCDIIVRQAGHRLLVIESCGSPPGSEKVAEQVRSYREMAWTLYQKAAAPPPEPDWAKVAEKLGAAGAARLNLPALPRE